MPTTTISPNPTYWATGTYDLSSLTNYINSAQNSITYTCSKEEEYIEKLEKHIDELEEDIEYFNGQLKEKEEQINDLIVKVYSLNKDTANMDAHITYLEARLQALEEKKDK